VIAEERDGVGGLLPAPETVAADLASLGVSGDKPVVVYDGGASIWASRLFWALEYLGHEQVHLLDGGLAAWEQAGLATSQDVATPTRGEFTASVREDLLAEQEYLASNLENDDVLILDARSPAEYRGEDVRAARGGHIPGAVNLEWTNNTASDSPRFRPIAELTEVYEEAMAGHDGEVVTLCQAGFRAAHSYVALRILGYEDARMYDGSWAEWGNSEELPIEAGA
jgi:thiosulfate/3-mercaptopyruvate sulfurtransferase